MGATRAISNAARKRSRFSQLTSPGKVKSGLAGSGYFIPNLTHVNREAFSFDIIALMKTGKATQTRLLSDLVPGQEAVIDGVHADEALHHRLAALGFRIGRSVQLLRRGVWAGPLHVRLGATDVMLRQAEACLISISAVSAISPLPAK